MARGSGRAAPPQHFGADRALGRRSRRARDRHRRRDPGLLRSASFIVAHDSGFDRTSIERARLPDAAGLAWVCSMRQVDWRARGFDGRVLGYLLIQNGFYHCGHRRRPTSTRSSRC
ncbi:hypothetical protein AB5I41_25245 [Sphingomonas sp. MMS24-JH45]